LDSRHNFGIIIAFMNQNEQTHHTASPGTAPSTAARINRTLSLSIVEGCAWAVMWGFGESFVVPFAVFLKYDGRSRTRGRTGSLFWETDGHEHAGHADFHANRRTIRHFLRASASGLAGLWYHFFRCPDRPRHQFLSANPLLRPPPFIPQPAPRYPLPSSCDSYSAPTLGVSRGE
jgi:hypothetical protein